MSRNIQLKDILAYLDQGNSDDSDLIQVVTGNREWDDYEELSASSELLIPFRDYYIWCIGAAKSDTLKETVVIRVDIHKEESSE